MPTTQRELPGLTVVRFFAAFAVLLYHFANKQARSWPEWLQNVVHNGHIGVPFFFILSGFILVYASQGREMSYRDFIVRRIARIYPAYVLAWLAFWGVHTYQTFDLSAWYWLKTSVIFGGTSLALMQSWLPGMANWNSPSWTLSCEAFFYAMFPVAFVWIERLRYRSLWLLLTLLLAASALMWSVVVKLTTIEILPNSPLTTSLGTYIEKFPPTQFLLFVLGMTTGHIFLRTRRLGCARWVAWTSSASIACLMSIPWPHDHSGFLRGEVALVLFTALIYSLASYEVKAKRSWIMLGHASYGMYILQMPVWFGMWLLLGQDSDAKTGLDLVAFVVVLLALCISSYLYFERPAEKWIKSRFIVPRMKQVLAETAA